MIERIICLLIGYLFGLFQTSYIVGRINGIDIREHGSGNAGATNTMRTLGKKAGITVYLGDVVKIFLAVLTVWLIYHESYPGDPNYIKLLQMYAGLGGMLGHIYPFYLKFKGGKGIASMGGFVIACFPICVPLCVLLFYLIVKKTRYVSLASMVIVTCFMLQLVLLGQLGLFQLLGMSSDGNHYLPEIYLLALAFVLLAVWKHRSNIRRLLDGTENKVGKNKEV